MDPQRAADLLGGRIVRYLSRNNEWVAIVAIEKIRNAAARDPVPPSTRQSNADTSPVN
jgi:hypothetical protein